jgi:hypothetical protein
MSFLVGGLINHVAKMAVTGTVGVAVFRALEKVPLSGMARVAGVEATKFGIRGSRALEQGVEKTRLVAGDLLADAREQMGEQAAPPVASDSSAGHQH